MFIVFSTGWTGEGTEELVAVNTRDRLVKQVGNELRLAYDAEDKGEAVARFESGRSDVSDCWRIVLGIGQIDADAADFGGSAFQEFVVYDHEPEWTKE
jgi:hypothetical protein